jgi:hemolysin activation/secretion protein
MIQINKLKNSILLCSFLVLAKPFWATAAPGIHQPNSGVILDSVRNKEPLQAQKPAPSVNVQQEAHPVSKPADAFKIKVKSFHVTGNTVFTESELQDVVATSAGKELTLADLETVAAEISLFYRSQGYFVARAYLPAQEIKTGIVNIAVLEGQIGNVSIKLKGSGLLSETTVKKIVAAATKQGEIVNGNKIERGILLVNDLAGVRVSSTMTPGVTMGTSDLSVEAVRMGNFNGGIDYDNFGNKYTGSNRIGASVNFNSPAKMGDQLGLRMTTSGSGMRYLRAAYLLPVGAEGSKIGTAFSNMSYMLGGDFAAFGVQGGATMSSLYALYPFIRGRNLNLNVQLGYDAKKMFDQAGGITTGNKRTTLWAATVSGDSRDELGMNSCSTTLTSGKLDLSADLASLSADAISGKTEGGYSKINFNCARLQRLPNNYAIYAALSGQFAPNNLDSSEKWVLGGASGIRAYPQGEASGDEGQLLNVEVRRDLGAYSFGNMQLVGFVDAGNIVLHKNTWAGWQGTNLNLSNSYNLYGAGMGLNLSASGSGDKTGGYSAKVFVAFKIGNNSGRDANGNDSDNASSSSRFWLQASKAF